MILRSAFIRFCASAAFAVALLPAAYADSGSVSVASFGGSYAESQKKAFLAPFQQETGIKANMIDYNGGLGEIRAQVETGNVNWDVVDVEMQDLVRGCDDGLFEPVADIELPPAVDGSAAAADFIDGTLHDCGVGTIIWSTVIAYNDEMFTGEKPSKMEDFFDVQKFPGKRGLMKKPQAFLEWSLIADGVDAKDVYKVLATPEGVDRALAKLDTIRDHIVWWDAHAQAPQLLADKEVAMTMAANGRIYAAAVGEGKPFKTIWDRQIWVQEFWAIPKGSKNLDAAKKFISFASRPAQMAIQAGMISYGPARKSAAAAVSAEMRPHLPTEAANFGTAFHNDVEFWADHGDAIGEQFLVWLNK
jgi:putative spermidine/putrescine transport system substrate-binding protein